LKDDKKGPVTQKGNFEFLSGGQGEETGIRKEPLHIVLKAKERIGVPPKCVFPIVEVKPDMDLHKLEGGKFIKKHIYFKFASSFFFF
jgi:hypothetical protein